MLTNSMRLQLKAPHALRPPLQQQWQKSGTYRVLQRINKKYKTDNKWTISETRAYISYPQFGPALIPLITCVNQKNIMFQTTNQITLRDNNANE